MSINTVCLSGNLTRDAELRYTQSGTAILAFGIAVNERRKNPQTGEWDNYPNFVDCVLFGKYGEAMHKHLTKGVKAALSGRLRYSSWEKDGERRSKLEVVVDEVTTFSQAQPQKQTQQQQPQQPSQAPVAAVPPPPQQQIEYDEDIPF